MGFNWDKYDTGGSFISAEEKALLAESGAPFAITGVVERESRFEHDTEFVVKTLIPEGIEGVEPGERALTFAKGTGAESRDRTLIGMMEYFDEHDAADDITAKLEKVGRAWFVKPVTS